MECGARSLHRRSGHRHRRPARGGQREDRARAARDVRADRCPRRCSRPCAPRRAGRTGRPPTSMRANRRSAVRRTSWRRRASLPNRMRFSTRELARSHSPYYFMLGLAANAKKRGDKAGALDWAEKAYVAAKGPATRLQWGVSYVKSLIANAPDDAAASSAWRDEVIGELEPVPETFYERNRRGAGAPGQGTRGLEQGPAARCLGAAHPARSSRTCAQSCRPPIPRAPPATARFVPRRPDVS